MVIVRFCTPLLEAPLTDPTNLAPYLWLPAWDPPPSPKLVHRPGIVCEASLPVCASDVDSKQGLLQKTTAASSWARRILWKAWPPATAAQMACWMLLSRTTSGRAGSDGYSAAREKLKSRKDSGPENLWAKKANPWYRFQ